MTFQPYTVFGIFGSALTLCSIVIDVIANSKEESEQHRTTSSKSNNPDQINFQNMSMKSAIGSRLIRDCPAIAKPAWVGPGSRHVFRYCDNLRISVICSNVLTILCAK